MANPNKKDLHWPLLKSIAGLTLFLKEIASSPRTMGAAWPSSDRLGKDIALQVPQMPGLVLELGAGTGAITEALLEHGIPPSQLMAIERAPALAKHLRKRFPKLTIIQGDARELEYLLSSSQLPVHTVVSSLPLRTLPKAAVEKIGNQLERILQKSGLFIQYTYGFYRKPLSPSPRLQWVYSKYIWLNFPPARIDIFRYVD